MKEYRLGNLKRIHLKVWVEVVINILLMIIPMIVIGLVLVEPVYGWMCDLMTIALAVIWVCLMVVLVEYGRG